MYLPEKQTYRFEDIELDLARGCLTRGGEEKHLRQQAFHVLVYLLERRDRLVPKTELFETVWNNTAVTDDVLVQCVTEIRRALGDSARRPRYIKTIPKSGYRFIAEIEPHSNGSYSEEITRVEFEIEEETETRVESPTPVLLRQGFIGRNAIAAGIVLVCFTGAAFYLGWPSNSQTAEVRLPQIDGRKTVAIMFFENQSGDADLEWLREGLADMLITNLSRSEKLTILSCPQLQVLLERAGHRAGDAIDLDKALSVTKASGAQTLVTGSFARLGEQVRLDVRLHDARTGDIQAAETLTAESSDRLLSEIDLLSYRLVRRFGGNEPVNDANLGVAMTKNLEAYRNYSLALEKAQGLHKNDALELLEKAVALDPDFAMAHARIGHTYAVTWGLAEQAKPHLARAFELSDRLSEKDRLYIIAWYAIANLDYAAAIRTFRNIISKYPAETEAYLRLGYLLRGEEQADEAINVFRQGLATDPQSPVLYNALGLAYSVLGRHDDAIAMHEHYVALSPNEANAHDSLGMSYQWAGRYAEAVAEYNRALELNSNFEIAYVHLGVAYFQTGRYAAAVDWFHKYIDVVDSQVEKARGHAYVSHVYRTKKQFTQAAASANRATAPGDPYIWPSVLVALDKGDLATSTRLNDRLFSEKQFTNRGIRNSPRRDFYHSGYIALRNGQADKALIDFGQALRYSPQTWDIDPLEDCLANAYLELGRYDEAIAEYERILRLNPNYPLAHFRLAEAYRGKGLTEDASASYDSFLRIWQEADLDIPEVIAARNMVL